MSKRNRSLVISALVAALMAATAWIVFVGQVPFTLQTFFVVLAACLLETKWASASMVLYVILGIVGLPVFAGGHAGLATLAGPTGGYLVGFVAAAALSSLFFAAKTTSKPARWLLDGAGAVVSIVVIDGLGMLCLAYNMKLAIPQAFVAGVAPFLIPDVLKAASAVVVARYLRRVVWGDIR